MSQKVKKCLKNPKMSKNITKCQKIWNKFLPCVFNGFSMIIVSSVRKIKPDNIHSSFNQFGQFFDGPRNRSDRADDVRRAVSVVFGVDVQKTVVLQNSVRFLRRQLRSRIGQFSVAHFSNFLNKWNWDSIFLTLMLFEHAFDAWFEHANSNFAVFCQFL